jgi:hypothetical protein
MALQNLALRKTFAHLPQVLTFSVTLRVSLSLGPSISISGHTREKASSSCGINIEGAVVVS